MHGMSEDSTGAMYGHLPKMAEKLLGSPHAASHAEIMNSAGKLLMPAGRTFLGDDELEIRVFLRMNKKFMMYMKKYYPQVGLPDKSIQDSAAAATISRQAQATTCWR